MIRSIVVILLYTYGFSMFMLTIWWVFLGGSTSGRPERDQEYNDKLDEIEAENYCDSYMDCGE